MQEIVKWSLMSISNKIVNRTNSFELFGYDFMVDEEYNSWLIEINSSPDMSFSTKVTAELVKEASGKMIDIVLHSCRQFSQGKKQRVKRKKRKRKTLKEMDQENKEKEEATDDGELRW